MQKNMKITALVAVFLVIAGVLIFLTMQQKTSKTAQPMPKVTIGIQVSQANALAMVAKDKGFFAEQGLEVELKEFTAGKFALQAFLSGSLDYCISGDVPPMLAAFQGNKFVVPAQLVKKTINEVRIVARRDGTATTAEEFFKSKKRKLATSIGGGPEFYTYEFLNKLGISKDQVEIISQKPEDMPAALVSGSVDAIAIFDPFAYIAESQLKEKSQTFTDKEIYSELYIMEAKEEVKSNPAILESVLRGLKQAEQFTQDNPEEAKAIVIKYTKLDKSIIDATWNNFEFKISLTNQLRDIWNREAAWVKETGKVDRNSATPDFNTYIYADVLRKIDADSVELSN